MNPSGKCFTTEDASCIHIDLRLDINSELAIPDTASDIQQPLVLVLLLLYHGRIIDRDIPRVVSSDRLECD